MSTHDKVCMISGGTSGIGLATVRLFMQQGYRIATCGRNQNQIEQLQNEFSDHSDDLLILQADLEEMEQTKNWFEQVKSHFGRIDVLVNNAAVSPLAPLNEISSEVFETTLNVNIRTPFYLTQWAWEQMKGQGSGVVVNISSLSAIDPFPGFSIYGASKAWLDIMTHALAGEGEPHSIRVYSIRCGAVETPMLRNLFPDFPAEQCVSPEAVAAKIIACVEQPDQHPSGEKFVVANQV